MHYTGQTSVDQQSKLDSQLQSSGMSQEAATSCLLVQGDCGEVELAEAATHSLTLLPQVNLALQCVLKPHMMSMMLFLRHVHE